MTSMSDSLSGCLDPFLPEDGPLFNTLLKDLEDAFADGKYNALVRSLFVELFWIVGNLPLYSGSAFKKKTGCLTASVKLACQALIQLRDEVEFYRLPSKLRDKEITTSKFVVVVSCLFTYVKLTAMTFEVSSSDGSVFKFGEPYVHWCHRQQGNKLTLVYRPSTEEEAAKANTLLLVHRALPEALHRRFSESIKPRLPIINKLLTGEIGSITGEDRLLVLLISKAESVVMGRNQLERIKRGDNHPSAFHTLLSYVVCRIFEEELSMEHVNRTYAEDKTAGMRLDRTITFSHGKVYAVVDEFLPLLTEKLQKMFPRQDWKEDEVLRICCECGIFELPENATYTEVLLYKDIWRKGGRVSESLPVKGISFANFTNFIARKSAWYRTYQAWNARYEVNGEIITRRELNLPDPMAQLEWVQKGQLMAQLIENGLEAVYKGLNDEDRAEGLRIRRKFDQMLKESIENKRQREKAEQDAKDAQVAPALLAQAKADAAHALKAYQEEKKSKTSLFEERMKAEKELLVQKTQGTGNEEPIEPEVKPQEAPCASETPLPSHPPTSLQPETCEIQALPSPKLSVMQNVIFSLKRISAAVCGLFSTSKKEQKPEENALLTNHGSPEAPRYTEGVSEAVLSAKASLGLDAPEGLCQVPVSSDQTQACLSFSEHSAETGRQEDSVETAPCTQNGSAQKASGRAEPETRSASLDQPSTSAEDPLTQVKGEEPESKPVYTELLSKETAAAARKQSSGLANTAQTQPSESLEEKVLKTESESASNDAPANPLSSATIKKPRAVRKKVSALESSSAATKNTKTSTRAKAAGTSKSPSKTPDESASSNSAPAKSPTASTAKADKAKASVAKDAPAKKPTTAARTSARAAPKATTKSKAKGTTGNTSEGNASPEVTKVPRTRRKTASTQAKKPAQKRDAAAAS